MSQFDLPLGDTKKSERMDYTALLGLLPRDPLLDAVIPLLQGKKLDIQALLPLLPLLLKKPEKRPEERVMKDRIVTIDDYRRV